jgi:cytochrome P450
VVVPNGEILWLITRYDDVKFVLSDPRFSRAALYRPDEPELPAAGGTRDSGGILLDSDPPEHTRLRRSVAWALAPRRVESLRPRIQHITDRLIDRIPFTSKGVDLNSSFAEHLPREVLFELCCSLAGVPDDQRDDLRALFERLLGLRYPSMVEHEAVRQELTDYLRGLISDKHRYPGPDLVSRLQSPDNPDGPLTEEEVFAILFTITLGGYHTTVSAIGHIVVTLLSKPGLWQTIHNDSHLVSPAIEETLRHASPGDRTHLRRAVTDTPVSGTLIPAGDLVIPAIPAANHDPAHFTSPQILEVTRADKTHLSFGHGPHFCVGAGLARLELRIAIETLTRRLPNLELAVPLEELRWYGEGRPARVIAEIPVRLAP